MPTENETHGTCMREITNYMENPETEIQGKTTWQTTDHQEYDDDAILYFEIETTADIQLQHYNLITRKTYVYNWKSRINNRKKITWEITLYQLHTTK